MVLQSCFVCASTLGRKFEKTLSIGRGMHAVIAFVAQGEAREEHADVGIVLCLALICMCQPSEGKLDITKCGTCQTAHVNDQTD
eukprot:6298721-Amphidinium_carterae.1